MQLQIGYQGWGQHQKGCREGASTKRAAEAFYCSQPIGYITTITLAVLFQTRVENEVQPVKTIK